MSPPGKIVVLNGFPGTGKLTILRQFKALLAQQTTCLLDNHLLIDPATAVFPDRGEDHHELRRLIRAPVFQKLRQRAKEGATILMTACLAADNERDVGVLREHLDLVRDIDVPLFWINAYCDQTTLENRLTNSERIQGGKTKSTDVDVLRLMLRDHRLVDPRELEDDEMVWVITRYLDVNGPVESSVQKLLDIIEIGTAEENS